jgi:hypothetical protein
MGPGANRQRAETGENDGGNNLPDFGFHGPDCIKMALLLTTGKMPLASTPPPRQNNQESHPGSLGLKSLCKITVANVIARAAEQVDRTKTYSFQEAVANPEEIPAD